MERDLKELEDFLWAEFDAAKARHPKFTGGDDASWSRASQPGNFAIENRTAMAELAQAIVAVRRERRVEKLAEDQQKIEDEIENGMRRSVVVGKPLKIKP